MVLHHHVAGFQGDGEEKTDVNNHLRGTTPSGVDRPILSTCPPHPHRHKIICDDAKSCSCISPRPLHSLQAPQPHASGCSNRRGGWGQTRHQDWQAGHEAVLCPHEGAKGAGLQQASDLKENHQHQLPCRGGVLQHLAGRREKVEVGGRRASRTAGVLMYSRRSRKLMLAVTNMTVCPNVIRKMYNSKKDLLIVWGASMALPPRSPIAVPRGSPEPERMGPPPPATPGSAVEGGRSGMETNLGGGRSKPPRLLAATILQVPCPALPCGASGYGRRLQQMRSRAEKRCKGKGGHPGPPRELPDMRHGRLPLQADTRGEA